MIEIEHLTKDYSRHRRRRSTSSLTIGDGEIAVIVGTSGSGKTTLMRMINRLVEPTSGTRPHRRQGHARRSRPTSCAAASATPSRATASFRTARWRRTSATVPKLLGWDKAKIAARVDELLTLFQLDPGAVPRPPAAANSPAASSSASASPARWRPSPTLLLMDEPFGALDPIIRAKAQEDLLAIQRRFGTTIVLVTHDMEEAIAARRHASP